MSVWRLPESANLRAEVLNKLAAAPWRMRGGPGVPASARTNLLRVLSEDLVEHESYLEVRSGASGRREMVLGVQVTDARAQLWQTNLAAALEQLTGLKVSAGKAEGCWLLKKHDYPNLVEYRRAGEWALLGLAQDENRLLNDVESRAKTDGKRIFAGGTKASWLEVDLDPTWVSEALNLGWKVPASMPRVALTCAGDNQKVRTEGTLKFAEALSLELKPWNIPTNMINDPLVSFAALRGIGSCLSSAELWKSLSGGPAPNQIFAWAQGKMPMLTFWAAQVSDGKTGKAVPEKVLEKFGPYMQTNGPGKLEPLPDTNGIAWTGFPFIAPYLRPIKMENGEFLQAGLIPRGMSNNPAPPELLHQVASRKDLVYYDWEVTPPRVEAWIYFGQLFRLFGLETQVPPESAAMKWLKAAEDKLGNCATVVTQKAPDELSVLRNSTIGLSSLELQLLVDWLESPNFPRGLYTTATAGKLSRNRLPKQLPVPK